MLRSRFFSKGGGQPDKTKERALVQSTVQLNDLKQTSQKDRLGAQTDRNKHSWKPNYQRRGLCFPKRAKRENFKGDNRNAVSREGGLQGKRRHHLLRRRQVSRKGREKKHLGIGRRSSHLQRSRIGRDLRDRPIYFSKGVGGFCKETILFGAVGGAHILTPLALCYVGSFLH